MVDMPWSSHQLQNPSKPVIFFVTFLRWKALSSLLLLWCRQCRRNRHAKRAGEAGSRARAGGWHGAGAIWFVLVGLMHSLYVCSASVLGAGALRCGVGFLLCAVSQELL